MAPSDPSLHNAHRCRRSVPSSSPSTSSDEMDHHRKQPPLLNDTNNAATIMPAKKNHATTHRRRSRMALQMWYLMLLGGIHYYYWAYHYHDGSTTSTATNDSNWNEEDLLSKRTANNINNINTGFVLCVTTRQDVLAALVLIDQWANHGMLLDDDDHHHTFHSGSEAAKALAHQVVHLELYHDGILSHYLQSHMARMLSPLVSVVDLSWHPDHNKHNNNHNRSCYEQALEMTHLSHAILIPPTLQFVHPPRALVDAVLSGSNNSELPHTRIHHHHDQGQATRVVSLLEHDIHNNNNATTILTTQSMQHHRRPPPRPKHLQYTTQRMRPGDTRQNMRIQTFEQQRDTAATTPRQLTLGTFYTIGGLIRSERQSQPQKQQKQSPASLWDKVFGTNNSNNNHKNNNQGLRQKNDHTAATMTTKTSWMVLSPTYLQWATVETFINTHRLKLVDENKNATLSSTSHNNRQKRTTHNNNNNHNHNRMLPRHVKTILQHHWYAVQRARRVLLLDAPKEWVALDGGFHPTTTATLNSQQAVRQSLQQGASIINVDLAMTSDHVLVGMHSNVGFTPLLRSSSSSVEEFSMYDLPSSQVLGNTSSSSSLVNPCLSRQWSVQAGWLPNEPYQPYHCQSEPIARAQDFVHLAAETSSANMIFDLKAPTVELQLKQAKQLSLLLAPHANNNNNNIAIRFFGEPQERLATAVIPEAALEALLLWKSDELLPWYINAPTALACRQFAMWLERQNSSRHHYKFQGCFVIQQHVELQESWNELVAKHDVLTVAPPTNNDDDDATYHLDVTSLVPRSALRMICDVPRKESFQGQAHLWQEKYLACVEEGLDYIHDPFSTAPRRVAVDHEHGDEYYSPLPIWQDLMPNYGDMVLGIIQEQVRVMLPRVPKGSQKLDLTLHWGYGSPYDWSEPSSNKENDNKQGWWLEVDKEVDGPPAEFDPDLRRVWPISHQHEHGYFAVRCIGKILPALLVLKLQEMDLVSMDDVVGVVTMNRTEGNVTTSTTGPWTYREIFSNVHNETFVYENTHWGPLKDAIEELLPGITYDDAIRHYVTEPMGLKGFYDHNTTFPPYASRGYTAPPEDLALIGSTLASGGVSPKTRKQIVSAESIDIMLRESINTDIRRASFKVDRVARAFESTYNVGRRSFDMGVMEGYGMGVWRVKWRRNADGSPIQGWLSMGWGYVYFDETGLVVTVQAVLKDLGHSALFIFSRVVREVGKRTLQAVPYAPISAAVNDL